MGDAASVNSFRDRGLYPFCAQAVLDLADQGQLCGATCEPEPFMAHLPYLITALHS
jgi:hypothetical protein